MRSVSLTCFFLIVIFAPQAQSQEMTVIFREGMEIGMGFDSVTGKLKNKAITAVLSQIEPRIRDQSFQMRRVSSTDELAREIGVSGQLRVEGLGAGVQYKADLLSNTVFKQENEYFLVRVKVTNEANTISPRPVDDAHKSKLNDPSRFRSEYGDRYVRGFITGGELYGLITISFASAQQREAFNQDARISGWDTVDGSAAVSEKTTALHSMYSAAVSLYASGSVNVSGGTTVPQLLQRAEAFPDVIRTGGTPLYAVYSEYEGLARPEDINFRKIYVSKMGQYLHDVRTAIARAEYVLGHAGEFEQFDPNAIRKIKQEFNALLEVLRAHYEAHAEVGPFTLPDVNLPVLQLPRRLGKAKEFIRLIDGSQRGWVSTGIRVGPEASVELETTLGGVKAYVEGRPEPLSLGVKGAEGGELNAFRARILHPGSTPGALLCKIGDNDEVLTLPGKPYQWFPTHRQGGFLYLGLNQLTAENSVSPTFRLEHGYVVKIIVLMPLEQ